MTTKKTESDEEGTFHGRWTTRIRCTMQRWGSGILVYIEGKAETGARRYLDGNWEIQPVTEESWSREPFMPVLEDDQAQELMDELWRCGVRPSDGRRTDEAMGAIGAHLTDMRDMAMRLFDRFLQEDEREATVHNIQFCPLYKAETAEGIPGGFPSFESKEKP